MKQAFVTYADEASVPGAICLARSLRSVSASGEIAAITLHTGELAPTSRNALERAGLLLREVTDVGTLEPDQVAKLSAWNLTEYDRVVWLDSDSVALASLEPLFRATAPLATCADFANPSQIDTAVMSIAPDAQLAKNMVAMSSHPSFKPGPDSVATVIGRFCDSDREVLDFSFNMTAHCLVDNPRLWAVTRDELRVLRFPNRRPWQIEAAIGSEPLDSIWWNAYDGTEIAPPISLTA